jgi:hypothetical protein
MKVCPSSEGPWWLRCWHSTNSIFWVLSLCTLMDCSCGGEIGTESHRASTIWECLWQSLLRLMSNLSTTDCSRGELNETAVCRAIYTCTLRVSVTGPTTGLSNPCPNTQRLLCLDTECSWGGEIRTESHRANYDWILRVSVTVLASSAVQSFSKGLLNVVNWRDRVLSCNLQLPLGVSVTGPTTGLSNPCLDTQRLLCLVMYCSRGGEIGQWFDRVMRGARLRMGMVRRQNEALTSVVALSVCHEAELLWGLWPKQETTLRKKSRFSGMNRRLTMKWNWN